ncbi:MAG TPA: methionine ABC transporter ATP-binding protein [Clostridia bacterium]|jgi:D-methionine transport system ATP-binding protein|nr:methionine ABC transporter ATP-binding protein [Clostridia bacterium]
MIKIENLTKIYTHPQTKEKIVALQNVNLEIKSGEIFGIIGPSGAGKSTFIRCLNLLEKPTSGSVWIDGEDITKLSGQQLREKRKQIGMIFQHFNLMSSRTVWQNVAYPMEIAGVDKKTIAQRVEELLELVGLNDKAQVYPAQLSGGQKQRVGIARALANNPKLLLCDEATSALDPQTTKSILQLLLEINRKLKITIILITHEMAVIREICDRVAVINESNIVEINSVLSVFTSPQANITKEFAANGGENFPIETVKLKPGERLYKLSFVGESAEKPIISSAIKKLGIEVNILYANIDRLKDIPFGTLIITVGGSPQQIEQTEQFFTQQGLKMEVLADAGIAR